MHNYIRRPIYTVHRGAGLKIVLESLTVKRGNRIVLSNLSAVMEGPGLYQVMGPNGSGKTTLLLTILGVVRPVSGKAYIEVSESSGRNRVLAYMPQSYSIPRDAPITVYEFVEGPLRLKKSWPRFLKKISESFRVEEVLELTGVQRPLWNEKLSRLSSGILQRVFLARTLITRAQVLLLDEPFSNIDPEGKVEMAELLGKLSREKLIVVTSHDPILLLNYTKKILLLGHGYYAYGGVNEILKYETLSKFYKKCALELEKHVHVVDWH